MKLQPSALLYKDELTPMPSSLNIQMRGARQGQESFVIRPCTTDFEAEGLEALLSPEQNFLVQRAAMELSMLMETQGLGAKGGLSCPSV